MQLHRKLTRKALIQKKFEEGLNYLNKTEDVRKGFKGKLLPETMIFTYKTMRDKRNYSTGEVKLAKTYYPDCPTE